MIPFRHHMAEYRLYARQADNGNDDRPRLTTSPLLHLRVMLAAPSSPARPPPRPSACPRPESPAPAPAYSADIPWSA
eukprot:ctg_5227.g754